MLIDERDERLIQKCVDAELSIDEARQLLQRLDALDAGWKTLACGLLEDRSLQRALHSSSFHDRSRQTPDAPRRDAIPMPTSQSKARVVARHWWSHPVTSLTLCAAIAFVGGMLIPDLRSGGTSPVRSSEIAGTSRPAATTAQGDTYWVQMTPGGPGVEVPVYDQAPELYRQDPNNPLFSDSGTGRNGNIQWMVVPLEGNRSMVIPFSRDTPLDIQ